jgi:5-methylcytosine-specific restriction endonuclease McrA
VEKAVLQGFLAQELSLETIGRATGKHPSTVSYWLEKHGLEPVHAARVAARGPIAEDVLAGLVARGLSVRQIAEELGRSYTTVRHWLRKYGLQTLRALPSEERPKSVERLCATHGMTWFVRTGALGYYRCLKCRSAAVAKRRRRVKEILVAEAGGRCRLCGYCRSVGALHFHHVDPATKSFTIAEAGVTRSLARAREEARKCVLLCSNCHAEVELGVASLP